MYIYMCVYIYICIFIYIYIYIYIYIADATGDVFAEGFEPLDNAGNRAMLYEEFSVNLRGIEYEGTLSFSESGTNNRNTVRTCRSSSTCSRRGLSHWITLATARWSTSSARKAPRQP